jgi:hypothetical protein
MILDMLRARPSALLGIVHQVLDSEVDPPPAGSIEHRALAAFVETLLTDSWLETWPELEMVRGQCALPPEPFRPEPLPVPLPAPLPPPIVTGIEPEHDFWQRAYLTALAAAMSPDAPYSADHIARLAVIAEGSADFALHASMKLDSKGEIGFRRIAAERQVQAQKAQGL